MSDRSFDSIDAEADRTYRRALFRILIINTVYYAVLAGAVAGLLHLFPALTDFLPVGGLSNLAFDAGMPGASAPIGRDYNPMADYWLWDGISLALAMVSTLLLMLPVSWVYAAIHRGDDFDHSIDETALILPAVVAGVVTVIQHSLALAFGLAGIVAGVRFRRALTDTFDTLFIFVAIGVGLAAGVGAIEVAVVITVFFSYATLINCAFGDGLESKFAAKKKDERKYRKQQKKAAAAERAENASGDGI
ncbi:MAG: DUF4956 domain-containing protein [Pseudomonadota bacterium]